MRIAYICADPGIPVFGNKGASIHVQEVIRALLRTGAQVELFAARSGGPAPTGLEKVRVHQLEHLTQPNSTAHREQLALAANAQLKLMLQASVQFDLIYERYSLWSYAALEYARAAGIRSVLEVNAPLIEEQSEYRELVYQREAEQIADRVFNSASVLLAVSQEVADYLSTFVPIEGRVHVIPNGVDPQRFSAEVNPAYRHDGQFVVGFVGSLKPWHDVRTLIKAFAILHRSHADARLLIVGDGPQHAQITAELNELDLLPYAIIPGGVTHAAIPAWLRSMDAAVAPYRRLGNFYFSPLKLFEYMAASRAIVASRIGQISSLITDYDTGLLCEPEDAEGMAAALETLYQNHALRQQLGGSAREWVEREHTWDAVVQRVFTLTECMQTVTGV